MSGKQRSSRFRLLRGKKRGPDSTADAVPTPEVIDAYSSSSHVTSMTTDVPTRAVVQQMKGKKAPTVKPDIILENIVTSCDDQDPLLQAATCADHVNALVSVHRLS